MEKKDFQKVVKYKMRELGFKARGNYLHKIIDDDYLIGIWMDHNPYCKGYYIEYSVVYLPDESKMPFRGFCDWSSRFKFCKNKDDDLMKYSIEDLNYHSENLVECFEYDAHGIDELIRALDVNIEKKLSFLYNKNYVLEEYKKELDLFIMLPEQTILKLMKRAQFDIDEVNRLRREGGYTEIIL